jgi:hypothetical protein
MYLAVTLVLGRGGAIIGSSLNFSNGTFTHLLIP